MRFSVRFKLVVSLSMLVVLGVVVVALSYRALIGVRDTVDVLAQQQLPLMVAAHELEADVRALGIAVVTYMGVPRPVYRDWADRARAGIDRYQQTYLRLADSARERQFGAELRTLLEEFAARSNNLLDQRDNETATLAQLAQVLQEIEERLHTMAARVDAAGAPDAASLRMIRTLLEVEVALSELGYSAWQRPTDLAGKRIGGHPDDESAFEAVILRLGRLPFLGEQRRDAVWIARQGAGIVEQVRRARSLAEERELLTAEFVDLRGRIHRLVDDRVEVLEVRAFEIPLRAVYEASHAAAQHLGLFAFPVFVASTFIMGLLMYRGTTRPLMLLSSGMRSVGQGNLEHKIATNMPNDEFGDLAVEFERMTRQLRERNQELIGKDAELLRREAAALLGMLVSGVAHEVRNPLFGITSTLDAMQARMHGQSEVGRHIAVLRGETTRLQKLMQDLLDYAKPVTKLRQDADLYAVIGRAAANCALLAQQRGVRIACDLRGPAPVIAIDTQRLEQVFVNLVENALMFSHPATTVVVAARREDRYGESAVICTVSDEGPGFAVADLHRVFEPFFTRRSGGTGLGLSIVQRIVEEHGGTIAATNLPQRGAELTVRLPVPMPMPPTTAVAATEADPGGAATVFGGAAAVYAIGQM